MEVTVRELKDRYPAPRRPGRRYEVLGTGESNLVPEVTDEMLVLSARTRSTCS